MYRIWVWQSTILKDDSQDPKHTLFCCENAFVAIFALFSDNKCVLFLCLGRGGGGLAEKARCDPFLAGFCYIFPKYRLFQKSGPQTFVDLFANIAFTHPRALLV